MVETRHFERVSRSPEKPAASCFGKEMLHRGAQRRVSVQGPPDVGFGRVPMSESDLSGDPLWDRPSPLG